MVKVLIVDDEPLVCEALSEVFQLAGHEVLLASNGVEAIKIVNTVSVDVAIIDIVMPEKDGLQTIEELKEIQPELKIIAISGGSRISNVDFLDIAEQLGSARAFYKPLDNHAIIKAVDDLLKS